MSLTEVLKLTEAEAQYLKFIQRVFESAKKTKPDDLDMLAYYLGNRADSREKWANRGVPYNTQDIITDIVHSYTTSGLTMDDYIAKNMRRLPASADSISEERTDFAIKTK